MKTRKSVNKTNLLLSFLASFSKNSTPKLTAVISKDNKMYLQNLNFKKLANFIEN